MYNQKKEKKKKMVIVISSIIIIIFVLFYSFVSYRHMTFLEKGFKDIAISIQKIIMYPFTELNHQKNIDQSDSYLIQIKDTGLIPLQLIKEVMMGLKMIWLL